MEEPEEPIINGDLSSESLGLNKGQTKLNKKILLIGGISIGVLLLLIIIIIIVNASNSDDNKDDKDDNDKKSLIKIGKISCIYDVQTAIQNTKILGNDFKNAKINIIIDGEDIGYSKEYKFKTMGEHKVHLIYMKI